MRKTGKEKNGLHWGKLSFSSYVAVVVTNTTVVLVNFCLELITTKIIFLVLCGRSCNQHDCRSSKFLFRAYNYNNKQMYLKYRAIIP